MLGVSCMSDLSFTCQSLEPPSSFIPRYAGPALPDFQQLRSERKNIFAITTNGANNAKIMHMNLATVTPRWSLPPLMP